MENMTAIETVKALMVLGLAMPQAVHAAKSARDRGSFTYWGVCVTRTSGQRFDITDAPVLAA